MTDIPAVVFLVAMREGCAAQETQAYVASSRDKAVAWIKQQRPGDWGSGWWAVTTAYIDTDITEELMLGLDIWFYDLAGNELEEQPIPLAPSAPRTAPNPTADVTPTGGHVRPVVGCEG